HQVASELSSLVARSVREGATPGVQQNPRRLAGARGEHDRFGRDRMMFTGLTVHETHAHGSSALVEFGLVDHGVRANVEISCLAGGRNEDSGALEIGADRTTADAGRGIEARWPAIQRPCQDRRPCRRDGYPEALKSPADEIVTRTRWRG